MVVEIWEQVLRYYLVADATTLSLLMLVLIALFFDGGTYDFQCMLTELRFCV